jgi:hypothetical protein
VQLKRIEKKKQMRSVKWAQSSAIPTLDERIVAVAFKGRGCLEADTRTLTRYHVTEELTIGLPAQSTYLIHCLELPSSSTWKKKTDL